MLTPFEKARVRDWLYGLRAGVPQGELAEDMSRTVPGWKIDRTRYSRYEKTGSVGPTVLKHLKAYWAAKGHPEGPDFTPPAPPTPELDPWSILERQTAMLERQETRITLLEEIVRALLPDDAERRLAEAVAPYTGEARRLADTPSPRRASARPGSVAR